MKKIVMPEPCSEDWSKMTPTEKGAFCQKCAIDVYDFTGKSNEEIRETLTLKIGKKTCGHLTKGQMATINSDYHLWETQSVPTFRSKFLYACLMVFGMGLFSGCEYLGEEEHEVGDIGYEEIVDGGMMIEEDDTLSNCEVMDNGELEYEEHKVGTVAYEEEEEVVVGKMIEEEE